MKEIEILNHVDSSVTKAKEINHNNRSKAFITLCVMIIKKEDDSNLAFRCVTDGGNDYGIDAMLR